MSKHNRFSKSLYPYATGAASEGRPSITKYIHWETTPPYFEHFGSAAIDLYGRQKAKQITSKRNTDTLDLKTYVKIRRHQKRINRIYWAEVWRRTGVVGQMIRLADLEGEEEAALFFEENGQPQNDPKPPTTRKRLCSDS